MSWELLLSHSCSKEGNAPARPHSGGRVPTSPQRLMERYCSRGRLVGQLAGSWEGTYAPSSLKLQR